MTFTAAYPTKQSLLCQLLKKLIATRDVLEVQYRDSLIEDAKRQTCERLRVQQSVAEGG